MVKSLSEVQETLVRSLGQDDPLEKEMATYSSILAWELPRTEELLSRFVSDSARPHRRQPTRLPRPWDSPGKNAGVGCCFLLQGIFPNQGSNLSLPQWQGDSLPLSHQGSPRVLGTLPIL